MLKRILAIFRARNLEFLRDRGTLSWSIALPIILVTGLSFVFAGGDRTEFTVGILQDDTDIDTSNHPFLETRYVDFVVVNDRDAGFRRVSRHQLDMLIEFGSPSSYWINPDSSKGYFAELVLLQTDGAQAVRKRQITGQAIRYVDWVLPGILGMNIMFSSLFGVGYVVVRYRKNGFLKRLQATPLRSFEFIFAQVLSRLVLILVISTFLYTGTHYFLNTRMEGSHVTLFVTAALGATSLISLGLMVAARVTSEELAGGLLNMATWPMMILSGVWFSLESAAPWVQNVAKLFPLTHVLDAARAVMLDGAGFVEVAPQLTLLAVLSVVFLTLGAVMFRWHPP